MVMTEVLNLGLLRQLRRNNRMSTEKVAEAIGKTKSAIWRYENGITDPTVGILLQMLSIYGASIWDIFAKVPDNTVTTNREGGDVFDC